MDVSPFLVVCFVLLIIIMLGSAQPFDCGVGIDLPKVNHPVPMPEASREDALIVAVMRDGKVFLATDQVTVDELPEKLREAIRERGHHVVYVRADGRSRYGTIKEALAAIRYAKVQNVAFLVDQRHHPSPMVPGR
jgi:biopolymer transport protein ExbD